MSLEDAVQVLTEHASGRLVSDTARLTAGMLALEAEALTSKSQDLLDAAVALRQIGDMGERALGQSERDNAIHHASIVSGYIRKKSRIAG